jgi:hypothetical protein
MGYGIPGQKYNIVSDHFRLTEPARLIIIDDKKNVGENHLSTELIILC